MRDRIDTGPLARGPIERRVLDEYQARVRRDRAAYGRIIEMHADANDIGAAIRAMEGLGGKISAAGRAAVSAWYVEQLSLGCGEMDLTPTVVRRSAQRAIGRGISMRELNRRFGRPGRTAADKSAVQPADLAAIESDLADLLPGLRDSLRTIRRHYTHALTRMIEDMRQAARNAGGLG